MKSQGNAPRFPVLIADEGLNFKKHVFDDPKVFTPETSVGPWLNRSPTVHAVIRQQRSAGRM